jgi:hypothetical protein
MLIGKKISYLNFIPFVPKLSDFIMLVSEAWVVIFVYLNYAHYMQNNFHQNMPPWNSTASWQEANRSLDFLIQRNLSELDHAISLAQKVQDRFSSIFSILDDLCKATCPWCPDPCCLSAKIRIDFKDLLFLHLGRHPIPLEQLLPNFEKVCRYWSPKGCRLPRMTRPWVCTWYQCPTQKANLRQKDHHTQDEINRLIKTVKVCRTEMEDEFIRIVCSG